MDRLFSCSLAVALACGAPPVFAADAAAEVGPDPGDQRTITVTGERIHYGVRSTGTATKTDTDIKSVPQALTIITSAQIGDQQLRSVSDLLNFVPGASYNSGEGNRDTLVLRGNSSTADFFVDGVRDDVQYFRDFYNVERVEVLKGPNAMIFGRGGGGGILNRVLKKPTLSPSRGFSSSADGWGGVRFTGDVDQPLSGTVGVRLNGMYEDADSFRHHVDLKRYGINPTATLLIGQNTRIDFSYEYFHDRRTADRGVPSEAGEPVRGFTRTFFGDPDDSYARVNANIATLAIEHDFGNGLTLRNRTLLGDYKKFYQNIFANSPVLPATAELPERAKLGAYNNRNDRQNIFSQTDLVWENRLARVDQTVLIGFELGHEKSRNLRNTGALSGDCLLGDGSVPLSDPTCDVDAIWAPIVSDANNRVTADVAAIYAQDQIRPAEWIEIVAGLRFDSFEVRVNDLRGVGGGIFSRKDNLWSPRLGLVFKPAGNLSIYTSYSRSYLPQSGDQFGSLTNVTEGLKPERFDNYEVGAKWEILDGLLATAAVYRLDRTNTRATDPTDPTLTVLTGAQRSRGIELGLERSVTSKWLVSAGYTLQKAEITTTTTAAPAGREVPLVPRHGFSLWNRYDLTRQFGLGLGLIARTKSYATISNTVRLPGYARVDGALFYNLPRGIETQINVENIFGVNHFPTANADNNIAPGAPRTIRATVGYSF